MANQWLGPWISITGLQETNAGQDINGGKGSSNNGWAPRNQRLGLAGPQEFMAGPGNPEHNGWAPRKTGNPEINVWAQIKSMAGKRS